METWGNCVGADGAGLLSAGELGRARYQRTNEEQNSTRTSLRPSKPAPITFTHLTNRLYPSIPRLFICLSRKFVFFNIPQIQYRNPWVQILMFKNMTSSPFLRFYLDDGEQVLVDVEGKNHKQIVEHVKTVLGKSDALLEADEQVQKEHSHPAHFGPKKYCLRECMCEVEGQVPCPGVVPLPKEMTGKYWTVLRAGSAI
ncbi:small ribosomal subunit protein mS25 isoform X1 [Mustelus asterias]